MSNELLGRMFEREAMLEERVETAERALSYLRREAKAMREVLAGRESAVVRWLDAMERTNDAGVLDATAEGRLK